MHFKIRTRAAGNGPNSATQTDANADGIADLIIANACAHKNCVPSGVVRVLLGKGDGTFRSAGQYSSVTQGASLFVTAADFNGDGKADLAVANTSPAYISILLGRGDGSFGTPSPYVLSGEPLFVRAADFNHDGRQDLAVTLFSKGLAVLLGRGNGTFSNAVNYATGEGPQDLAIADFNRDGNPDVAVVNNSGTVALFLGRGDGTFPTTHSVPAGISPLEPAVADFNHDGKPDLVVSLPCAGDQSCSGNGGVGVLLGNGDGTFKPVTVFDGTGLDTARVGVGDFNGDGKSDVVALNYNSASIDIFLGRGDGTLKSAIPFAVGANPLSPVVADFDGSGSTDVAVLNQIDHTISIMLNGRGR